MSDDLRYGTENNPIRLINDNSYRKLISQCPDIATGEGVANIDLGKIRGEDNPDPFLIYVMNLISNPNIDDKTVRLGCWLYTEYQLLMEDIVYDVTDIGKRPSLRNLGDDYFVYVGNPNSQKYQYHEKKFPKLIKKLSKVNIKLTTEELIKAISDLHDFYYITATDICLANSYLHTKVKASNSETWNVPENADMRKKIDDSTSLVHIHITTSMTNKFIGGKWLPFNG